MPTNIDISVSDNMSTKLSAVIKGDGAREAGHLWIAPVIQLRHL